MTGLTNALGMRDTVSYYKEKGGSNPQAEGAYRDGVNYQSVNVLGYENFQGNKAEWLQYVTVNKTAADGRWFITMPDGTERVVQGITVYNHSAKDKNCVMKVMSGEIRRYPKS